MTIGEPSRLRYLCLDRSSIKQDYLVTTFAQSFPFLETLCLCNSTINDDAIIMLIEHCKNLKHLNVSMTEVRDIGVRACGGSKTLEQIYLDKLAISSQAIDDLLQMIGPRLTVLSAQNHRDPVGIVRAVTENCHDGFGNSQLRRLNVFTVTIWGRQLRGVTIPSSLLLQLLEVCVNLEDLILDIDQCASWGEESAYVKELVTRRFPMMIEDTEHAKQAALNTADGGSQGSLWAREHGWT
ncbi:hypothetical protein HDU76_003072 [Blyttiomyces sp. JEL0837]|nr:hypothetical protein HDU76_003072 [Blyttiomyces sp. JEL0837]